MTRAKDKLCKDVISAPVGDFQGSGKTFNVTLISKGESKVIECPDDMYILEAAEQNGIDLPATCKGVQDRYSLFVFIHPSCWLLLRLLCWPASSASFWILSMSVCLSCIDCASQCSTPIQALRVVSICGCCVKICGYIA